MTIGTDGTEQVVRVKILFHLQCEIIVDSLRERRVDAVAWLKLLQTLSVAV